MAFAKPVTDVQPSSEKLHAVGHVKFLGPVPPQPCIVPVSPDRPAVAQGNLNSEVHERGKQIGPDGHQEVFLKCRDIYGRRRSRHHYIYGIDLTHHDGISPGLYRIGGPGDIALD